MVLLCCFCLFVCLFVYLFILDCGLPNVASHDLSGLNTATQMPYIGWDCTYLSSSPYHI